jgi:phage tail tape-measure protein
MIRLQADIAEIQGLAQAQAQRQQPFTGIASQWSAANAGMGPSPLGPLAQANPLPAGLAAPTAEPMAMQSRPQARRQPLEVEEVEASWESQAAGAAQGALGGAGTGAAIGSVVPGIGTAIGAAGGAVIGGLGGYLQARG